LPGTEQDGSLKRTHDHSYAKTHQKGYNRTKQHKATARPNPPPPTPTPHENPAPQPATERQRSCGLFRGARAAAWGGARRAKASGGKKNKHAPKIIFIAPAGFFCLPEGCTRRIDLSVGLCSPRRQGGLAGRGRGGQKKNPTFKPCKRD
jgi:hypothetical protein